MTYTIRTRAQIGLDPVVRNSNGTPRPKLVFPLAYETFHYTGVNVRWGDVGDTDAEIRGIEDYAASAGKPNEYNAVIHQDPDDLIHEYAGRFRAAHSAGENSIGHGLLLLNGINEPITRLQIDKVQWLMGLHRYVGVADASTLFRGHRDMPNAATACPGASIYRAIPYFDDVWRPPVEPPPPPVEPEPPVPVPPADADGFGYYLIVEGRTPWGISAEVYGTGTRWPEIMEANAPDTTPNPGERWLVPGFSGVWYTVQPGDSPWKILRNVFGEGNFGGAAGVAQFQPWNGGASHTIHPGDRVWVRT